MVAELTREEWLAKRTDGIGASEVSAVFGLNPWKSPYALWAEKCGLVASDGIETEWQRWGNVLEPVICEEYSAQTGRKVIDHGRYAIRRSTTCPVLTCTLDREVEAVDERGPGVMDAKNVGPYKDSDWADGAPLIYQIQIQAQLEVTGYKWGSLAVLIGGQKFRWIDVERNDKFIEKLRAKCLAFWKLVETREAPPVDGSDSTSDALARLNPIDDGETIALPGAALEWDEAILIANETIKAAEARKAEAQNQIKAAMGAAAFGVLPDGGRYSFKTVTRKGSVTKDVTYRALKRLSK